MSLIYSSARTYTFTIPPRPDLQKMDDRTQKIHTLQKQLLERGRKPLKELFSEEPLTLVDQALKALPELDLEQSKTSLARYLYDDSTQALKRKSAPSLSHLVDALTLPVCHNRIQGIKPNNLATQSSDVIKNRCQKAINYLYPKTLANHPDLAEHNIPMPRSTELLMNQAFEGMRLTLKPNPFQGGHGAICQTTIQNQPYIIKTLQRYPLADDPKALIIQEQIANLLFANTSDYIVTIEAMTKTRLFLENFECGDLIRYLTEESTTPPVSPDKFHNYCISIIEALIEIEAKSYYHGDIKPDNIFLSNNYTFAKLGDLGFVRKSGLPKTGQTLPYVAPEIFQGENPTIASDVFSFGAVVFLYLSGCFLETCLPPHQVQDPNIIQKNRSNPNWYSKFEKDLQRWLAHYKTSLDTKDPKNIFRSLLVDCVVQDPTKRPSLIVIKEKLMSSLG